ncbi:MAG: hypothetical protein ACTHMM_12115 [Agriterribacter sp.]
MKTKVLMITMLLLVVSSTSVFAQNKFKPLIERIALLQVYLEYLQKGYSIAKNGWETVRKITKGEFDLHADYFTSLESVKPEIKKYARVGSIITIQLRMVKAYKEAYRYAKDCEQFTPDEVEYLSRVFENVLTQTAKDIELLTVVITNNKVKMEDKERLAWIDKIHEYMKDKEKFLYTFNAEMYGLARARDGESHDSKMLQKIYQP